MGLHPLEDFVTVLSADGKPEDTGTKNKSANYPRTIVKTAITVV